MVFYQNERWVVSQTAMVNSSVCCTKDKAFDLGEETKTETVTFAGQGGMISVETALEAAWLNWACQRSWGSFFWSSTALMAQQFLRTDGSFCSSCSVLWGHNLHWTGKTLQALDRLVAKTFCMWLNAISSGSLSQFSLYVFYQDLTDFHTVILSEILCYMKYYMS